MFDVGDVLELIRLASVRKYQGKLHFVSEQKDGLH